MYLFPLVMRELRTAPRRVSTWRIRFIVALISSAMILMFAGVGMIGVAGRNAGAGIFWFMAGSLFFLCLVEGWRNSADCISEEKREGTLGLLLLTDLSPLDVILGKLAAFVMNSISMILAAVPGITLAVFLGGVTFGEVVRVALACLVALSVSMSVGVIVSSSEHSERRAMLKSALILVALLVIPTMFLPAINAASLEFIGWVMVINPIGAIGSADDFDYSRRPDAFWIPFIGCLVFSLGLVMAAARIMGRRWNVEPSLEGGDSVGKQRLRFRWLFRRFPREELGVSLQASAPLWLLKKTAQGEFRFSAMIVIVVGCWFCWAGIATVSGFAFMWWNPVTPVVGIMLVVAVCAMAIRPFSFIRKSGFAESLLTTPFDLEDMVSRQRLRIRDSYSKTIACVIIVDFVSVGVYATNKSGFSTSALNLFGGFVLVQLLTVVFLAVLGRCVMNLSMWTGLTESSGGRALAKTLLWAVGPMLLFAFVPCCGVIGGLVVLIHLGSWADKMLKMDLREVIVDRLNVAAHESAFLPYGYLKSKPLKPPRVRRGGPSTMGT